LKTVDSKEIPALILIKLIKESEEDGKGGYIEYW